MLGAGLRREFGLFLRTDSTDDMRAEGFRPLAEYLPDPAGSGMDEDRVALLHPKGPAQQILRREALEHHAGRGFVGNALGQRDQDLLIDNALLRIEPGAAA